MPITPELIVGQVTLASPLFVLVSLSYTMGRWGRWGTAASKALSAFVFTIAMPAMLFRKIAAFGDLSTVDARLLIAFFGGCALVFLVGRLLSWHLFRHDGTQQSVFTLGSGCSTTSCLASRSHTCC
jgi:predicted permease